MKLWIIGSLLFFAMSHQQSVYAQIPDNDEEHFVDSLLRQMTLSEKVEQLSGRSFDTRDNNRLNIPGFHMTDGPIGVGQPHKNGSATAFPAVVALAATWDTSYAFLMGKAIAYEAQKKGKNFLLAPCMNMQRFPGGGRNFETFSEDPYLSARMAVNYIKGVQSEGIIACAKHFVCNNQERNRVNLNVNVDEKALREIYFPAFKASVQQAKVAAVMTSYNKVNGKYSGQNPWLINQVLKKEWGFDGITISDWESIYSTTEAALAGLDMEMPWARHFGDSLIQYVRNGSIDEHIVDEKVKRILRIKYRFGLFHKKKCMDSTFSGNTEHRQLALAIAKNSLVLLKNKNQLLPLNKQKMKNIAIIGPNANVARMPRKGSVNVKSPYSVSSLDGIKALVNNSTNILFAQGCNMVEEPFTSPQVHWFTSTGKKGIFATYFNNKTLSGTPVIQKVDTAINFNWGNQSPSEHLKPNNFSVRWQGRITVSQSGFYSVDIATKGGYRFFFNDTLRIDQWFVWKPLDIQRFVVYLKADKSYPVKLEYFESEWEAIVKMGVRSLNNKTLINQAVEKAAKADAAIVFAGFSDLYEQEGNDRTMPGLPYEQVKLIQSVAAANKNTIVVVSAGTPIEMVSWIHNVAAVLYAWYAGMETGNAIAQTLFGYHNPCGRLPFSIPLRFNNYPVYNEYFNQSENINYTEGVFNGYRYFDKFKTKPLFPFGFGLSYTDFHFDSLKIIHNANCITLNFRIKNTGDRNGAEIVQVYVEKENPSADCATKKLKRFKKVFLKHGEIKHCELKIRKTELQVFHAQKKKWILEPGDYKIHISKSSDKSVLTDTIKMK